MIRVQQADFDVGAELAKLTGGRRHLEKVIRIPFFRDSGLK